MLPAEDAPIEAGTMIGEYRVDRKLGSGTFGDVYAGEQPLIGKRVAIKLLHRKFSSDAEVVSRFVAEARAVNRIRHRNIIDIFSFGMLGDSRHYFVMELLDGLTLSELLHRERRLSLDTALPLFRGIASGLDAAHEAGITHRDLKPDNVFLAIERDGSFFPKLLDFGIAKLVDEEAAHKTATGVAMGTPRYMSPEQCRGKPVDHRADIYSLGVVIHEALTGQPLFDGDSSMDVLFKHTNEPPPRMSSVSPDLPPELDEPVLAMLAKRPKQRPASAGEAVAALIEAAKAAGKAASVQFVSARIVPPSGEGAAAEAKAPRIGTDDPTVAVRQRTPARSDAAGGSSSRLTPISTDAPTVAMAVSGGGAESTRTGSVSVRVSTEVAPASANGTLLDEGNSGSGGAQAAGGTEPGRPGTELSRGHTEPGRGGTELAPQATLRSPGPIDAAAPATSSAGTRGSTKRGAWTWAVIGVGAAAVIAGVVALSRGGDRSSASALPASALPASALPAASQSASATASQGGDGPTTVSVTPDRDKDMPATTLSPATGAPAQASAAPTSAPTGTGKALAKPKLHKDLARPPELGP
jgi:serine/threonine-protein kinase